LATADVGLEAGPVFRLGTSWEIRAGAGGHLLHGHANRTTFVDPTIFGGTGYGETSFPFTRIAPTVFGALQYAGSVTRGGVRVRVGIEARQYIGAKVDYPEYGSSASIADRTLNIFMGVELPWGSKASPRRDPQ
jgi:hypothetical protein